MDASTKHIRSRGAFTLVELLVVVAIIGILASLITAAAIAARRAATEATIQTEIGQLDLAMTRYKTEHQEFPPDFFMLGSDQSKQEVARHIIRVFPRYDYSSKGDIWDQFAYDMNQNYGLDVTKLDPASALVFWLGGPPETKNGTKPAGFHSDPRHPFKPGKPRTRTFYEFSTEDERLVREDDIDGGLFRYYAKNLKDAPFVYFKARQISSTGRWEYGWVNGGFIPAYYRHLDDSTNKAVPYLDGKQADNDGGNIYGQEDTADPALNGDPILRPWRNSEKFQIQHPGLDARYGDGPDSIDTNSFRYTKTGRNFSENQRDHTNLLNGASGSLGDDLE